MSDFNIGQFNNNALRQQQIRQAAINQRQAAPPPTSAETSASAVAKQVASEQAMPQTQNLQMSTLKSLDRAIYAKDLMGVPKNINEFIYMMQRGLNTGQFNAMFSSQLAAQRNSISQLQAQILAQLQGLDFTNMSEIVNKQMSTQLQASLKNLEILSNGMINLNQIAQMLQANGKEALTKLIMTMTQASKMGINDLSQLKEMAKLINQSIAVASENNPTKTMKLLLLLYLPWLPLKEGVDFDLDVTQKEGASESDSILTVTITTINFGTVVATLFLETSNSVQVTIQCAENFPKDELDMRLDKDKKHYSVDTLTSYEVKKDFKPSGDKAKASVDMGQTTEVNPYLLLTAHSIIKHVIDIDNNASIGITGHVDWIK